MFILDDGMLYKINKNFAFTAIPISTPMSNFLIYRDEIRRKTEFSALREDLFTYEFKIVKMNPRKWSKRFIQYLFMQCDGLLPFRLVVDRKIAVSAIQRGMYGLLSQKDYKSKRRVRYVVYG